MTGEVGGAEPSRDTSPEGVHYPASDSPRGPGAVRRREVDELLDQAARARRMIADIERQIDANAEARRPRP
ncbi:MAG TPA: hypothetical protein VK053_12825 [Jiangellaceae bacterium]|nr:hypothetical protein [Jiangellaceae bacterium]